MTIVNTVLGPIETADLGFTLMHEHVVSGPAGLSQEYPELFGPDLMERIVVSLVKARNGGINTIVDATTFDLGRNISLLQEASRRSGVNIIACTGWWMNIPPDMAGISANQLA